MTSAHRPTFDPARGKEAARGPAFHQRLLPAHTTLKTRQTTDQASVQRDLRAELLKAEAASLAKKKGIKPSDTDEDESSTIPAKRRLEQNEDDEEEEDPESKRRREILERSRDEDADSVASSSDEESSNEKAKDEDEDDDDDEEDSDEDSEDEMDDLMAELQKIKKERAEQKAKEEAERAAKEEEQREFDIARGNPLLNPQDFSVKRRWDDDVIFKNQARGTEDKNKPKEFVNDLLRSDFHKRFMNRYVR